MKLLETPDNPVPPGAQVMELKASDGVRLRAARYPAASGAARGTICLFSGRAEVIEKFHETIADFTRRGFTVATLDWRGQGGSQRLLKNPRKGHVRAFDDYQRDLDALMTEVVLPHCPRPHFAVAHSTGGLILFRALTKGARHFERVLLSSPFLGLGSSYEPLGPLRAAAFASDLLGLGRFYVPGGSDKPGEWEPFLGNILTSDPRRHARFAGITEADPGLAIGSPTIRWVASALRQQDAVTAPKVAERIAVPLLIIAAGKDSVVSNVVIDDVARRLRTGRRIVVENALHELMCESDIHREQFMAAADAFLRADA